MPNQDTPKRRSTDVWLLRPVALAFILLTLLFLGVLIGFALVVTNVQDNSSKIENLVKENSNRIADVQISRTESCKTTYDGIKKVIIQTFLPPPPLRTPEQLDRLENFNKLISDLKSDCGKQTSTEGG